MKTIEDMDQMLRGADEHADRQIDEAMLCLFTDTEVELIKSLLRGAYIRGWLEGRTQ
jgi:hypothetical protein